ncbi:hypothetical protein EDD16DRAFT_1556492 [Pisolithus croceorrhizus]|nr:hypothetical protein EDD16DRAFT_1556492 [Pisolithus croceorrhizus]
MSGSSFAYFRWLYQQQVIKYFRVAPISIWVFDFFLTLEDEIRLLTRTKRWGLTHVLYIPTRYFPIIGSVCAVYNALVTTRPEETCVALYRAAEIVLYFGMLASEGLLLIRTLALWHSQNAARSLLIGTYALVAIIMFVCAVISSTLKFEGICGERDASVATALATQLSHVTVGMFSSAAFFELVVIFYTLLYTSRWGAGTGRYATSGVVAALTHGNVLYALSLFVASIVNITFFVLPLSEGWNGLFVTFQAILHGVMASRILFELQVALSEGISLQIFTNPGTRMEFTSVALSNFHADGF